jgi:Fe-S cluster assembly protein SufB
MPLQAYFRMNAPSSGQFEHTLIIADEGSSVSYIEGCSAPKYTSSSLHAGCVEVHVLKNAKVQYSSIENWSKNTYNLNTKKALVYEGARMEWLNGNMGSRVTMLYPSSILLGEYAHSESLGVVIAGEGQIQDTGSKVIHLAPHTTSIVRSKSISQNGGVSLYRGFVKIAKGAVGATAHIECDALIRDDGSESITLPTNIQEEESASITHEAKVGTISLESLSYIQSRGFTEEAAVRLLVGGFMNDVVRKLPLEYAVELNKMIDLEITGM